MSTLDAWRWTDERGVQRLVSTAELRSALASGVIPASTLVWRHGMEAWEAASTLAEFADAAQLRRSSATGPRPAGESTAADAETLVVVEASGAELEIEVEPDSGGPATARSSQSDLPRPEGEPRAAAGDARKEARPQPSPAPLLAGPLPGTRKRESMRTLKGIDAPGAGPPSAPSAPIVVPSAGGTFDAGVARAITQLPRYGTPHAGNDGAMSIPRAPRLPSPDGRRDPAGGASHAGAKVAPVPRPVGGSALPRPMPTIKPPHEPGKAASPGPVDKVAAATPPTLRRPSHAPASASRSASPPARPFGRSVPPPPVPVRLPAIPQRKFPPSKAPPAAPSSASNRPPALGRALPPPPPLQIAEATQPSVSPTAAPASSMTVASAPPASATVASAPPASAIAPSATAASSTLTSANAIAATPQPAAFGSSLSRPARQEAAADRPAHAAAPAFGAAPGGGSADAAGSSTGERSALEAHGSLATTLPGAAGKPTLQARELPDEDRAGTSSSAPSPLGGGVGASDRSSASPRRPAEPEARVHARTPGLDEALPDKRPRWLPARRARLSPARLLRSMADARQGLLAGPVPVPVSSLVGSGGALIFMVVASFLAGRCSVGGARTAAIEPARSALGAAPGVARSAIPAPPRPCWVARQPRRWAPLVAKSIPFDVATTSAGTFLVGYARTSTESAEIEINPTTGELNERFSRKESADIVRITSGEGDRFSVITAEQRAIRSTVNVPASTPFTIGVANGAVVSAPRADGEATRLWALQGDEQIEAPRALVAGSQGYAVAFRRDKAVWLGWLDADRKPKGELTTVTGSGGAVGKPSISWNGQNTAVVFADRPAASGRWEIRAGRAAAGAVPALTQVIPLPGGGPGGDAFAPDIAGLDDGRWLLVWTEGPAGSRAMRAQTLASDFTPVGDPIALSPPAGNFGQGLLGVSQKTGYVGAVFLSKPAASYELWGVILQCG